MIIDTSALVAVMRGESGCDELMRTLAESRTTRISGGTLLETGIVIDRLGDPVLSRRLDDLLEALDVAVEPVTPEQVRVGRQAYRDFGKGSGHPAALNFGDCFAYALARTAGAPLLFVGNDFGHTDVSRA
ncbi:MAG: type II toxin-antitoxin system VapC family toxin [Geodermatophilaceae bacterium]|nr:type II toxin-antitoxin system VapC family toxin [Geodermatophilaceae bacterium]MDQ3476651.1 type II toxin-antitoxin system VapC family toxin [Actinomycetota bacterium]